LAVRPAGRDGLPVLGPVPSAATERDALAMEREFRRRVEAGITGRILVRDLVEEWWASGPRLAPTTAANYKLNLGNHILPVLGDKRADEIRPRLVGQFLRRLVADGMHPATVRKVRSILSAVTSYAVAMDVDVGGKPVVGVGHAPQLHRRAALGMRHRARVIGGDGRGPAELRELGGDGDFAGSSGRRVALGDEVELVPVDGERQRGRRPGHGVRHGEAGAECRRGSDVAFLIERRVRRATVLPEST
jgi:hypothetical protein